MEPGHIEFVHRSWPADPNQLAVIRHELTSWLTPLRLTDDETADVVLAVDEAAANAVLHAYGRDESGAVELTLWTEPGPGVDERRCRSRSSTTGTGGRRASRRSQAGGASRS